MALTRVRTVCESEPLRRSQSATHGGESHSPPSCQHARFGELERSSGSIQRFFSAVPAAAATAVPTAAEQPAVGSAVTEEEDGRARVSGRSFQGGVGAQVEARPAAASEWAAAAEASVFPTAAPAASAEAAAAVCGGARAEAGEQETAEARLGAMERELEQAVRRPHALQPGV